MYSRHGASWGGPGALLGVSWGLSGASWGFPGSVLGEPWGKGGGRREGEERQGGPGIETIWPGGGNGSVPRG